MSVNFRKSFVAGVIGMLMAAPGIHAAPQMQSPHADREHDGQPMVNSPAPSGEVIRSLPGSDEPAARAAGEATRSKDTLVSVLTPRHLKKMVVIDTAGKTIGNIEDVVRSREDGFIYAVISSGGILGIGAQEVPVPLEELQVRGDKLRIATTRDTMLHWPAYQEDQYVELEPSDKPISEFSAFEVIPPDGAETVPEQNQ